MKGKTYKKKVSAWSKFRTYIRRFNIGDFITRKNMRAEIDIKSIHTLDNFRRVLQVNNVIRATDNPGIYMIINELPENITLNEMMLRGYGKYPKEVPRLRWWGAKPTDIIYEKIPGVDKDPLYKTSSISVFDLI